MRCCSKATIPPKHQADVVFSQANPLSGTKYTVLNTTKNVRILGIQLVCTWTVQPNPLECHITIDGQLLRAVRADPVSATKYYVEERMSSSNPCTTSTDLTGNKPFIYEGRNVKIEVEVTGGTVSNLSALVKYAKW